MKPLTLDPDRCFAADGPSREVARALYSRIADLPIISPHGHTDPRWFAENSGFGNATDFLLVPDHYLLRMLHSQGIDLAALGVRAKEGAAVADPRAAWRLFAEHYYLFRGTPCRIWLDHVFANVLGLDVRLDRDSADHYFDHINEALASDAYRPRAILDRFNVALIATTEGALDSLTYHDSIIADGWGHRVITTLRPDDVLDPDFPGFNANLTQLAELTGCDTTRWDGYLDALRARRAYFRARGATATDHGHPTALTADLTSGHCQQLLDRCRSGEASADERESFRGQMLTEMAGMSREDGMTMQLHPGVYRNHNTTLLERYGRDKGADIPLQTEYVRALHPLLNKHGHDPALKLIVFTLDETTYARELAPLAGHWPALKLGPPWWFNDSAEGMLRFRRQALESAGFYNTVGFNDDTRALLSIPARHDLARRMDCRFLAELVCEGRLERDEAEELITELTVTLVRDAYGLTAP